MKTEDIQVAGLGSRLRECSSGSSESKLNIGDRVQDFDDGIVVDIDEDAVVVARRNAEGRCMELVFVGEAAGMLHKA